MKERREDLEGWWVRADSHERMQAIMLALVATFYALVALSALIRAVRGE